MTENQSQCAPDFAGSEAANRPLMVFDGDCGFCRAWIEYWKQLTGDRIAYAPYQEVADRFPDIPREKFAAAVQLILPSGEVCSGAQAVFTALADGAGRKTPLWIYAHIPGAAAISEAAYGVVARRRSAAYALTRLLWGLPVRPESNALVRWLFLRVLGAIYLIAFLSFGIQAAGLIGSNGILPIVDFLPAVHSAYGRAGYWMVPTLFWINSSDAFLRAIWMTGAGFSLLVVAGLNHRFSRLMLFLLYLSLVAAGQVFMGFQWDALLLETGFLAIFLSSSGTIKWLFRWLLFRLMLLSGAVKLLSGDPTWRNFTALTYHYQTQPLPTPLAWYMQQLPEWFQRASVGVMFFVELAVPFLIFAPRRVRMTAALLIAGFQTLIFLTGNYTFFNLLTIALCLFLLDDAWLARLLPGRAAGKAASWMRPHNRFPLRGPITGALAGFVLLLSASQLLNEFFHVGLHAMGTVESAVAPFELVNSYGLFAVMTTTRPEIVIEGSNDGSTWQEYEFKYKPGNVYRRPRWVEPFQPRLDWQMWFAALGNYQNNPWVLNLMVRLLQEKPEVTGLLERNPFPGTPPRYMRALVYQYRFTTTAERRATGAWWQRQLEGGYTPVISLRR